MLNSSGLKKKATAILFISLFSNAPTHLRAENESFEFKFSQSVTFGHENSGDSLGFRRLTSTAVEINLRPAGKNCSRKIRLSIGQSVILNEEGGYYCKYTLGKVRGDSAEFNSGQCGIKVSGVKKRCERELVEVPNTSLNDRIALWRQQSMSCNVQGYISKLSPDTFPTKEYPESTTRSLRPEPCNDGDMALFNGLLCAVGEYEGCKGVSNAQDQDRDPGRWWRSPAIKRRAQESPDQPNLNSDQALGVLLYVLQENDWRGFRHWLQWVKSNGMPPHFCSLSGADSLKCSFRPVDCPLVVLTGYALGEQDIARSVCGTVFQLGIPGTITQLGIPNPASFRPRFEDALNQYRLMLDTYNDLRNKYDELRIKLFLPELPPSGLLPVPQKGDFESYIKKIDTQVNNIQDLMNLPDPAGFAAAYYVASAFAVVNAAVAGTGQKAGEAASARHLAGTALFLLQKLKMPNLALSTAAAKLLDHQPENPYFEFLARGQTQRMYELIMDQCKYDPDSEEPRFQWSWERPVSADAVKQSMSWDCIFIADLWQKGLTPLKANIPKNVLDPMRKIAHAWENLQDAEKGIEQLIKTVFDQKAILASLKDALAQALQHLDQVANSVSKGALPTVNPDGSISLKPPPGAPPGSPTIKMDPKKGPSISVGPICIGWGC